MVLLHALPIRLIRSTAFLNVLVAVMGLPSVVLPCVDQPTCVTTPWIAHGSLMGSSIGLPVGVCLVPGIADSWVTYAESTGLPWVTHEWVANGSLMGVQCWLFGGPHPWAYSADSWVFSADPRTVDFPN